MQKKFKKKTLLQTALLFFSFEIKANDSSTNDFGPTYWPKNALNWSKMGPKLAKFKNNHFSFFFPALKVKLMVRRPMTTLVEQGILPSPKTSPALYEQKQKLERAKKGDLLKSMIAKRPDRQELVHR